VSLTNDGSDSLAGNYPASEIEIVSMVLGALILEDIFGLVLQDKA